MVRAEEPESDAAQPGTLSQTVFGLAVDVAPGCIAASLGQHDYLAAACIITGDTLGARTPQK